MMMLWLAQMLGLKELGTGLKWTVRLVVWALLLAFLLVLLVAAGITLYNSPQAREAAKTVAALGLGVAVVRFAWLRWKDRTDGNADAGARTIDGKIVPDKLAVAALDVPSQSPDADYVLRGLPDYAKALLKLNGGDFEYVPETPEPESPLEEPAVRRSWLVWARQVATGRNMAAGAVVAALLYVSAQEAFHWQAHHKEQLPRLETESLNDSPKAAAAPLAPEAKETPPLSTPKLVERGKLLLNSALDDAERGDLAQAEAAKKEAFTAIEAAALQGDAEAEYLLGCMYINYWQKKLQFSEDDAKAQMLFLQAGFNRNPDAEFMLGMCYALGKYGFERDPKAAAVWLKLVLNDAPTGSDLRKNATTGLENPAFFEAVASDAKTSAPLSAPAAIPEAAQLPSRAANSIPTDGLTWTDNKTGLTWTTTDNGKPVNWEEAKDYCTALTLEGRRDWRLPNRDELLDLWEKKKEERQSDIYTNNFEFGHGFRLRKSPVLWTAEMATQSSAYNFDAFKQGSIGNFLVDDRANYLRAICVR